MLQKEAAPAPHQSAAIAAVSTAASDYAPGSLKAELCLRGREQLLELCERERILVDACGTTIVVVDGRDLPALDELERRGSRERRRRVAAALAAELTEVEPACTEIAVKREEPRPSDSWLPSPPNRSVELALVLGGRSHLGHDTELVDSAIPAPPAEGYESPGDRERRLLTRRRTTAGASRLALPTPGCSRRPSQ